MKITKNGNVTVLVLSAHPDDAEMSCGGTLAKYSKYGHKVVVRYVCKGDKGGSLPPAEMQKIREKEASNAAKMIGAELIPGRIPDSELFNGPEVRKEIISTFRKVKPDIVITHAPEDYHPDHRAVSVLACDALYVSTSPGFKTGEEKLAKPPGLYFMDTLMGVNFLPTDYVDITGFIAIKERMLGMHKSQFAHLKKRQDLCLVKAMKTVSAFRGLQCGVEYAEAFRLYPAWPNYKAKKLLQ